MEHFERSQTRLFNNNSKKIVGQDKLLSSVDTVFVYWFEVQWLPYYRYEGLALCQLWARHKCLVLCCAYRGVFHFHIFFYPLLFLVTVACSTLLTRCFNSLHSAWQTVWVAGLKCGRLPLAWISFLGALLLWLPFLYFFWLCVTAGSGSRHWRLFLPLTLHRSDQNSWLFKLILQLVLSSFVSVGVF